jgi:hypothetical protein
MTDRTVIEIPFVSDPVKEFTEMTERVQGLAASSAERDKG